MIIDQNNQVNTFQKVLLVKQLVDFYFISENGVILPYLMIWASFRPTI